MGLPRRASQLPLTAISLGLTAWERSAGLRHFATRRANEALQIAAHTPLGRLLPQQVFGDNADEEAARIAAEARAASAPAAPAPTRPAPPRPTLARPATEPARPAAEPARPAAATPAPPKPQEPPAEAKEVGAPGAVTAEVEEITEELHVEAPESRDELPIPDFDNISMGSLRARLRSLTVEQLVVLREWEQQHANRLQVVTTLDNRIAKLSEETGQKAKPAAPRKRTANDVGAKGTDYPQEAVAAERTAEEEGGTLRI